MRRRASSILERVDFGRVEAAAASLEDARPEEILRWAVDEFGEGLAIATGFGLEGLTIIDMAVRINPAVDVFFVDTGFHFAETYALRHRLEARYGIRIRSVEASLGPGRQEELCGPALWTRDPDLCCRLRKVEPLAKALRGLDAWVTGIRRSQTAARARSRVVQWDARFHLVKVSPLARWTSDEVRAYVERNGVPYNPLHDQGYPSVGCTHCTRAVRHGEDERAGRWPGFQKTECGLHADR